MRKRSVPFIYFFLLCAMFLIIILLFVILPQYSGHVKLLPQNAGALSICTQCCDYFENQVLGTVMSRQLSYRVGPFILCGLLYLISSMAYAAFRRRSYVVFSIAIILIVFVFHILWASWYFFVVQFQIDGELGNVAESGLTLNLSQFNVVKASATKSTPSIDKFVETNSPWMFARFQYDGMKNIFMFLMVLLLVRIRRLSFAKAIGIRRGSAITWAQIGESIKYGIMCGLIMSFSRLFYAALQGYDSPSETWWYGFLFIFVVLGAFFEEVLFRNIVLGTLVKIFPFWSANVINGFLFSIWHLQQNSLESHLNLFIVGSVFGFIWYRYGIPGCTIAHLACNYCSMFLSWFVGSLRFGW